MDKLDPFGDITKFIQGIKIPGIDMSAIAEARRKDIQAVVDANKAAYEAMQALAKKQSDMLSQTMQGIQDAAKSAAGGKGLGDQTEVVRNACEKALTDMKELAELARSSQAEMMSHITKRAAEHMEELKSLMHPKK